jgi:hypothetical protein
METPKTFPQEVQDYKLGNWFDATTVDLMEQFYLSRLPALREAAKKLGYALGLHGSMQDNPLSSSSHSNQSIN